MTLRAVADSASPPLSWTRIRRTLTWTRTAWRASKCVWVVGSGVGIVEDAKIKHDVWLQTEEQQNIRLADYLLSVGLSTQR